MRIVKKYPNRRLYDTEQSRYITLSDLQQLIMERVEFKVKDANTGADLTRRILLQIVAEQENGDKPIFTTTILATLIRFYGDAAQDELSEHLKRSLSSFEQQHS